MFHNPKNHDFTFIDLFAGIGGFRLAMNGIGGKCVFSSEYEKDAQKTYFHNFGDYPSGDITLQETKDAIPQNFDILCGGFPCQAFSIAGHRKGFDDIRGTLFFDVAQIIEVHKPKVVLLENVKNLKSHDKGETFKRIKKTLEDLGYVVYNQVLNAMDYANVPQNRERIFIVCFDPMQVPNYEKFRFPQPEKLTRGIQSCLAESKVEDRFYYTDKSIYYERFKETMTSKETVYQWRRQYVRENKSNVCPTLTANMGTGGHNVPIIKTDSGIRKLTPKECLNFQGYPEGYSFPKDIAVSKMYMQAGNSVVVPLVYKICKQIKEVL